LEDQVDQAVEVRPLLAKETVAILPHLHIRWHSLVLTVAAEAAEAVKRMQVPWMATQLREALPLIAQVKVETELQ
jgi:hypothetical protein